MQTTGGFDMKEMYQLTATQVMNRFNSSTQGLTSTQAEERHRTSGWNELTAAKPKPLWKLFLEQFQDFLVIILIIAAIISGLLGDAESAAVILVVIALNAILGTVQTRQAERSLNSLKNLSAPKASVLRDGSVLQLPAKELVPGDIVLLEAGDIVPADGRIIECISLKIDESALTGESLSVDKIIDAIPEQAALGDRRNMVFSGSFITNGRGKIVITDIGMHTEVGKIANLLHNTSAKRTPLQTSLDSFGKKLSIAILIFCGILFGMSVFRGESIGNAFLFAVALAVAAIPEALSSIVTIVLSFGTQKMAKEHAIIRKLQAVEGLGSISVICSDKTGTLTQNKMTVEHYYVNGQSIPANEISHSDTANKRLYFASVLCNDAKIEDKNEQGIGELVVKGPNVMLGYYENEEETKEVLKDGWLYTGDLAYIDKEGYIYISGRKKNLIVLKNGKKIFPEELEELVKKLELVSECMVFGLPKDDDVSLSVKVKLDNEIVKEKYSNLSEEELEKVLWEEIKEINKKMPTYKYMKHLFIEKGEFIKTTTNKIKRNEEMKKIMAEIKKS